MKHKKNKYRLFHADNDIKGAGSQLNITPATPDMSNSVVIPVTSMFQQPVKQQEPTELKNDSQSDAIISESKKSWYDSEWFKWTSGIVVLITAFLIIRRLI